MLDRLKERYMYMDFPFFGFGGGLFMLFFWIIVIWLVVYLIQKSKEDKNINNKTALDILKERYAKGEIDKKEYNEKKKDLLS